MDGSLLRFSVSTMVNVSVESEATGYLWEKSFNERYTRSSNGGRGTADIMDPFAGWATSFLWLLFIRGFGSYGFLIMQQSPFRQPQGHLIRFGTT